MAIDHLLKIEREMEAKGSKEGKEGEWKEDGGGGRGEEGERLQTQRRVAVVRPGILGERPSQQQVH